MDSRPKLLDMLQQYTWPGNVRELQGVIKESMLRTTGRMIVSGALRLTAQIEAVPATSALSVPSSKFIDWGLRIEQLLADGKNDVYGRLLKEVDFELLTRALRHAHGHLAQTSELLGISRSTLRTKLRELGIALERVVAGRTDESPESE